MKKIGMQSHLNSLVLTPAMEEALKHETKLNAIICAIASKTTGEEFTMNFPVGSITFKLRI